MFTFHAKHHDRRGNTSPYAHRFNRITGGLFGQATVEDSKLHRRPYNPPFSRPAVIKKERLIREKIDTIIDVLDKASGTDQVVDISSYYRALTTDIIAAFSFGKDMDLLHNLEKGERLYAVWRAQWRRMARFEPLGLRRRVIPLAGRLSRLLPSRSASTGDPESLRAWEEYREVWRSGLILGSAAKFFSPLTPIFLGDANICTRRTQHYQSIA